MTDYIVSEEELGKLINTYLVNINVGYVKMYKGKKQTIKDFLESKQPVELVAEYAPQTDTVAFFYKLRKNVYEKLGNGKRIEIYIQEVKETK